ncbi:MAG: protein kinase domain-containing protein [Bacillota bacterium]
MAKDEKTILDAEETILDTEAADATLPDDVATMPDDATVLDGEAAFNDGNCAPVIEKGVSLLDTYRIESDAIEGGMGAVWRVHHTGWNVDLAMKRPKSSLFQSEKQKENFVHECEAWINLGLHPHIVSCYYVREIDNVPSIFSEWMDGGSLKNAIEDERLYEGNAAERILDISIQFARGLHYAHEQGLIHQDVKPDNLLLTKNWDAKVADFGIARARATLTVLDADIPTDATIFSASGGYTPAYCSMEQMNGGQLTRRTDIYSWAVSVMEMYLGERPWQNGVIAGAACEEYFPDAKVTISQKMQELLRKCLNAKETERPHDFAEIEKRLLEIYRGETGKDYPRPVSKAAADTADSLNNRALSYIDLGNLEDAQRCWKQALVFSPGHLESSYNQSLLLWRNGVIDDREAARRIAAVDKQLANRIDSEGIALKQAYDFLTPYEKSYTRYYNTIQLVAFDDGLYFLLGHESGSIACTEVISKKMVWSVTCHKNRGHLNYSGKEGVGGLVVSPDKRQLYSYGPDGLINRINIRTGDVEAALDISKIYNPTNFTHYGVSGLSMSFDAKWIACISDLDEKGSPLFILDAKTLQPKKILKGRNGQLSAVGFLPNGCLITSSGNREISIWDVEQGVKNTVLAEADIKDFSVCADGNILACDNLGQMVLMDASGRIIRKFTNTYGECHGIHTSQIGIAVACFDHVVIYDTHSEGCARTISGSKAAVTMEGRYLVTDMGIVYTLTQGEKSDYILCAIKSFNETESLNNRFQSAIRAGYDALKHSDIARAQDQLSIARSLKGEDMECIRLNDAVGAYGTRTGVRTVNHISKKLEHPYAIADVGVNHAKDTILCLSGQHQIYLYTKEGNLKKLIQDIKEELSSVYFSSDDKVLICLGPQETLLIDVATNEAKKLKKNYIYVTTDLQYGIVKEENAGSYSLRDLEKDIAVNTLHGFGKHALRTIEQNNMIYLFFADRIGASDTFISDIAVVSLNTLQLEERYCFSQNTDYRANTAFSVHNLYCVDRSGRFFGGKIYKNQPAVLSPSDFWDCDGKLYPTDKSLAAKFDKNPTVISDAEFSDDGKFLCTADTGGMLKIYSNVNQNCVKELGAHTGEVKRVALDGSLIITGGQDGLLKLWNVVWEYTF